VSAVRPLGSLSMARGCARIDAGPDTAKIGSAIASRSITPGYLQLLGFEKRFHTAWTHRRHRDGASFSLTRRGSVPRTDLTPCISSRLPSVQIGPAFCTTILRLVITIPSLSTMTRFVVPRPTGLSSNERLPCAWKSITRGSPIRTRPNGLATLSVVLVPSSRLTLALPALTSVWAVAGDIAGHNANWAATIVTAAEWRICIFCLSKRLRQTSVLNHPLKALGGAIASGIKAAFLKGRVLKATSTFKAS